MNPKDVTSGTGTSAEGLGRGSSALSPALGAFPDVRLLPDGRVAWSNPHPPGWVAIHLNGGHAEYLDESDLPLADAQRMVPAGALLELLPELDQLATEAGSCSEEAEVWVRSATDRLCARLGSLLGEPPESHGALDECDLRIEHYPAPGQPAHEGLRAVRITHAPTGITASSDSERTRLQNTVLAIRELTEWVAESHTREGK